MVSPVRTTRVMVAIVGVVCACLDLTGAQGKAAPYAWEPVDVGLTASFRGLSLPDSKVIWIGGSEGVVARSVDGGVTWEHRRVEGAETLDFRDVFAVDQRVAYLLSSGPGELSRIYKTTNGGRSWRLQYTNRHPQGFLNGMAFWDGSSGIAVGDPIDGRLYILRTTDGRKWRRLAPETLPPVLEGEYGFAASGTGIATYGSEHVWIATGGAAARVFRSNDRGGSWKVAHTPLTSGNQSSGIFSIAFRDDDHGVVVGGDYRRPDEALVTVARTSDGGRTWSHVDSNDGTFRSCVAFSGDDPRRLISVGTNGSGYSLDRGRSWKNFGELGFNTVAWSGDGTGWAVGADGKVARLVASSSSEQQ